MKDLSDADRAEIADVLEAWATQLAACSEHVWQQVGSCVYCCDCKRRLYQGTIPEDHSNVKASRSWSDARNPKATRDMRARWGKDQ